MEYLFIAKRVEESLEILKQRGRQFGAVVGKADRILESLRLGQILRPVEATGKRTKYGEKRIKNCQKYDLGSGYRMIVIQRGSKLFITFLGTHDECQRWLARNSKLKEVAAGEASLFDLTLKAETAGEAIGCGLPRPERRQRRGFPAGIDRPGTARGFSRSGGGGEEVVPFTTGHSDPDAIFQYPYRREGGLPRRDAICISGAGFESAPAAKTAKIRCCPFRIPQ